MKSQIFAIAVLFLSFSAFAEGEFDGFTPTTTEVNWLKVDTKAIDAQIKQIREKIAAKKKLADQQAKAAQALRKRQWTDLAVTTPDPSREPYDSTTNADPILVAARQKELAQMHMSASELDASVRSIQDEITDLTFEETKLGRDIRRATSEQVGAMVKREQAAEDAQKEAARVKREADQAAEKARAVREKQFQAALETMALTQSFQSLQSIVNDTNRTLDEIERKYDQAILGAYMKDKMKTLLNSQAFCSAAVNCELAEKDRQPIDREMDKVFPWSDPKLNRAQPRAGATTR
jgi:chromosome segregation ATPase